jgi:hypothetical protein
MLALFDGAAKLFSDLFVLAMRAVLRIQSFTESSYDPALALVLLRRGL